MVRMWELVLVVLSNLPPLRSLYYLLSLLAEITGSTSRILLPNSKFS